MRILTVRKTKRSIQNEKRTNEIFYWIRSVINSCGSSAVFGGPQSADDCEAYKVCSSTKGLQLQNNALNPPGVPIIGYNNETGRLTVQFDPDCKGLELQDRRNQLRFADTDCGVLAQVKGVRKLDREDTIEDGIVEYQAIQKDVSFKLKLVLGFGEDQCKTCTTIDMGFNFQAQTLSSE